MERAGGQGERRGRAGAGAEFGAGAETASPFGLRLLVTVGRVVGEMERGEGGEERLGRAGEGRLRHCFSC